MTNSWHLFDPYSDPDCDFDAHGRAPYIHDEGGEVIAVMNDAGEHDQEARTNGKRMAATPELLAALEAITDDYAHLLKDMGDTAYYETSRDQARAAIKKAKGTKT